MLLARDDPAHEGSVAAKFERHGIGAGQLVFAVKGPERGYLELHNRIDLMLDPFPYNGGVTTGDCLWMGTPILALEGDSYVSRQGVSLLTSVGLPELIAADREALVAKAAGWFESPERLAKLGDGLAGEAAAIAADGSRRVRPGIYGGARGAHHGLTVTQSMSFRSAYSESTRSFSMRMARTIDDSSAWPMCGK